MGLFIPWKWFNTVFLLITITTILTKISKEHADGTGNVQIPSRCSIVQKKRCRGEITFFPDLCVFAEHSPSIGEPVIGETTCPFPPIHQSQKLGHMLYPCRFVGVSWFSWFSIASSNEQHFKGIIHVLIFKPQKKPKEFCPSSSSWQTVDRSYSIVVHPLMKDSVDVNDTGMGNSHCEM